MTAPLVQSTSGHANGATTASVTLTGVTAGDFLVLIICNNANVALQSLTDSNGEPQQALPFPAGGGGLGIYFVPAAAAGTHKFTATFSGTWDIQLYAAEFSASAASELDVASAMATGNSVPFSTAPILPGSGGELIVGVFTVGGNLTATWSDGLTPQADFTGGPSSGWAWGVQAAAEDIAASGTLGFATSWSAAVVAFGGGSGQPVKPLAATASDTTSASGEVGSPIVQVKNTRAASATGSLTLSGVTPGNSILALITTGGNASSLSLSSLADNGSSITGAADNSVFPYSDLQPPSPGSRIGIGVYAVPNVSGGAHEITWNVPNAVDVQLLLAELNGGYDPLCSGGPILTGNSASPLSAPISSDAGDLLIAIVVAGAGAAIESWGFPFTGNQGDINSAGPTTAWAWAWGGANPDAATATISPAAEWGALICSLRARIFNPQLGMMGRVTLTGTLNVGPGSILDPSVPWSNGVPGVGDSLVFDSTVSIAADGTITPTSPAFLDGGSGTAACQWVKESGDPNVQSFSLRVITITNGVAG